MAPLTRDQIARRACRELRPASNGLGMPLWTFMAECIHPGTRVLFQTESGTIGALRVGSAEADRGASSASAPAHDVIETVILGAQQVSARGDLAVVSPASNVGPSFDQVQELLSRARRVVVLLEHTSRDGSPRLLHACELPVLGRGVVRRIISEVAVIDVTPGGLFLREVVAGTSARDVQERSEPLLKADQEIIELVWS